MRDVRPLHAVQVVHLADAVLVSVILLEKGKIELGQVVARKALARLGHLVHLHFELGEEDLAEKGLAKAVQVAAEEEELGGVVFGLVLEHVVQEEVLVQRAGHLGHEDGVVRGDVGLVPAGKEGVHGVARLVGQRGDIVVAAHEVQELVGVHIVGRAVAVRARFLALGGHEVHPAGLVALLEVVHIGLAEGSAGFEREVHGLLGREGQVHILHDGGVEVLVAELLDAHHPLPELEVAVQGVKVGVHIADELLINGRGDVVPVEGGLKAGAVVPGVLVEHVRLDLGVERCAQGPLELVVPAPKCLEHEVPVRAVAGGPVFRIRGRVQERDDFARGELHILGVGQVGVGEDGVDRLGRSGHLAVGLGHELLARRVESVVLHPQDVVQVGLVVLQPGLLGHKPIHLLRINREDLGPDEGDGGPELRRHLLDALNHFLALGDLGILVRELAGVGHEARQVFVHPGHGGEPSVEHLSAVAQVAFVGRHLGETLLKRVLGLSPRRVVRVQVGQVPGEPLGDLGALGGKGGKASGGHGNRRQDERKNESFPDHRGSFPEMRDRRQAPRAEKCYGEWAGIVALGWPTSAS